jgi:hypothetical protein
LQAEVALLAADKRQSARQLQQLLAGLHGVEIGLGTISALTTQTGALLAPAAEALHQEILGESAVFADETSWRVAGRPAWLWGLFSRRAALYKIAPSRKAAVARSLIPAHYAGIVHTDCYSGYSYLDHSQRQLCFAHLRRHFQAHAERAGPARAFGERGLRLCARTFALSRESTPR